MFFYRCSYKNSELVYNSRVLLLMVYTYKDVPTDLALNFARNFSFVDLLYFLYNLE